MKFDAAWFLVRIDSMSWFGLFSFSAISRVGNVAFIRRGLPNDLNCLRKHSLVLWNLNGVEIPIISNAKEILVA